LTIIEHRVPVTGRDAPLRISRALDQLARDQRPEVTLIVRGGGADIDLDVFNHPAVVAAIGRHPRPVVAGIGHATNSTHADEAAHTSCITPTAAATELRLRLAERP
jgi:exodeoxyribonuclease VII large subunit